MPDSTQHDLMRNCYNRVIAPIAEELRKQAAQGEQVLFDDTKGRIIENYQINRNAQQKKSIHTTVIVSLYKNHRICLFDTNADSGDPDHSLLWMCNTVVTKVVMC